MLGWEDALKEYLPEPINARAPDSATETPGCAQTLQPDVQTLINFLKKTINDDCAAIGLLLKDVEDSLKELVSICPSPPGSNQKHTRRFLNGALRKLSVLSLLSKNIEPISDEKIITAIDSLTLLKVQYNTTAAINSIDKAIRKIESLKIRSPFTPFKGGTKLTKGIFSGTIHCELCLAVLVYLADRDKSRDNTPAFEGLLENFKVIIISSTACILLMLY